MKKALSNKENSLSNINMVNSVKMYWAYIFTFLLYHITTLIKTSLCTKTPFKKGVFLDNIVLTSKYILREYLYFFYYIINLLKRKL